MARAQKGPQGRNLGSALADGSLSDLVTPSRGGYNLRQMRPRNLTLILAFGVLAGAALAGCALATKAPPVAKAGPDVTVHVGEMLACDGSSSVDLDGGKIVYYQWRISAAPEGRENELGRILREGQDAATCPPGLLLNSEDLGEWLIELKVTDDEGQSATDDLVLTVIP
jgi:hypothetical protein